MSDPVATPGWYPDGSGHQRYWDGTTWTEHSAPLTQTHGVPVARTNGIAIASMILGICGFLLTPIPFFVGLFLGGIPDILAIIFGIVGLNATARLGGAGKVPAILGIVFGGLAFLSIFIGAGSIW